MRSIVLLVAAVCAAFVGLAETPVAWVRELKERTITDTEGREVALNCAVRFDAWEGGSRPTSREERQRVYERYAEYLQWGADFVVTFDRPVRKGSLTLYGQNQWLGARWFPMGVEDIPARTAVRLLGDIGVTYQAVLDLLVSFNAGVRNLAAENNGLSVCVELRLYERSGGKETGRSVTASRYFYQFPDGGRKRNWFDTRISWYREWPADSSYAEGGAWETAKGVRLEDVADVGTMGRLEVNSIGDGTNLAFAASSPKTLGGDAQSVTIETWAAFETFDATNLPAVKPDDKCAVCLVRDGAETYLMGLEKVGGRNALVRLRPSADGAEPPREGVDTEVVMRLFLSERDGTCANYTVGGVDYLDAAGRKDIPIVARDAVKRVEFRGAGEATVLLASAEPLRLGLMLLTR